jgi:hypothetical protein
MKCLARVAALLLSVAATHASAQSAPAGQGGAQETQARRSWTDPATGLTWAGKDNGKDVTWKEAMKHCRDLRVAGYSDWRLATLAEGSLRAMHGASTSTKEGRSTVTYSRSIPASVRCASAVPRNDLTRGTAPASAQGSSPALSESMIGG